MAYIYSADSGTYADLVARTDGALSEVSPGWFGLNDDGSLAVKEPPQGFVAAMHASGIRVLPFLADGWDKQKATAALEHSERLSRQVCGAVELYGFDGVHVDIECITEKNREDYIELLQLIREEISGGKAVSVAVAANPYDYDEGWQAAYDYNALAAICDYLMLMAYDEHYLGGEVAGPVAGITFVEQSIKAMLAQGVPGGKIVLGIPLYGRLWSETGDILGEHVPLNRVDEIASAFGAFVGYDAKEQSPVAVFSIGPDDTPIEVNYKMLTPGRYTLWYEDSNSIWQKLKLAEKYDLKGVGYWSLGQEDPSVWSIYAAQTD